MTPPRPTAVAARFNAGEVIGINEAYIDGFSGGTLGVSVQALRPLITAAQKRQ